MPESNVRRINGVEITGTPVAGDVPVATSGMAAAWGAAPAAPTDLTNAVILAPGNSARNVIEATGDYTGLTVKQHAGQTEELFLAKDSSGNDIVRIDPRWTTTGSMTLWARTNPLSAVEGQGAITGDTSAGIGVAGTANASGGIGVEGYGAGAATAVKGVADTGTAVHGTSTGGVSGLFQSASAANGMATVVAKAIAAQTANLQEWQTSAGAFTAYVDAAGVPHGFGGGQSTFDAIVAATGGDYTTVAAAIADGKYRLFVKNGTYAETPFAVPASTNFVLVGESKRGVVLQYTTPGGVGCIRGTGTTTNRGTMDQFHIQNVTIQLSGTLANNTIGINIIEDYHSLIDNVSIIVDGAVSANGSVVGIQTGNEVTDGKNGTVKLTNIDLDTTSMTLGSFATFYGILSSSFGAVINGFSHDHDDNTQAVYAVYANGYHNMVSNVYAKKVKAAVSASSGNVITNVNARICKYGVEFRTNDSTLAGLYCLSGVGSTNSILFTGDRNVATGVFSDVGVSVGSSSDNCVLSGATLTASTAVTIASGATNFTLSGVNLAGSTNKVSDSGTGTVIRGCVGVDDSLKTANNAQWTSGSLSEEITLSTSGTTTDSAANLLPANSVIESVVARVTTTITTATDWSVGDATTAARFVSANATMTAGTTSVGLNHQQGSVTTDAAGPVQTTAAKVRITTTGTPGAGKIRVTVFYKTFAAPTS